MLQPPIWTGHADFNHPFEFIAFCRNMADLDFDVVLEAKAKDLALLRLREDLLRYAPDVAGHFGLLAKQIQEENLNNITIDPSDLDG